MGCYRSGTCKEIVTEWIGKGATEIYGFSGRHGMIFTDLSGYATVERPARINSKGCLFVDWHGNGFRKVGQIVHREFGWS